MYIYKYQTRHFHFHKFMERISYACLLQLPYVHVRVYCSSWENFISTQPRKIIVVHVIQWAARDRNNLNQFIIVHISSDT